MPQFAEKAGCWTCAVNSRRSDAMGMYWPDIWVLIPMLLMIGGPLLGLVVGLWIDREHRENLEYRRRQVGHVLVTNLRSYPWILQQGTDARDWEARDEGAASAARDHPPLPRRDEGAQGGPIGAVAGTELIVAEVVLANNAFLTLIGRLKMLFGGEVKSFYGLLTRARQEATLRVMERAAARGHDAVCNLRLFAVDISGQTVATGNNRKKAGLYIGIIAYGMAYRRVPGMYPPPAPPTLMDYLN